MSTISRLLLVTLLAGAAARVAGVAAIALTMTSIPAKTHVHVDRDGTAVSWYPLECCHDGDCRPVASIKPAPHGLVMTTVDGYSVLVDHGYVRRPSRDMRWHICIGEDVPEETAPRVRCVFEPPSS